jgi:hypothetical protein
LHVLAAECLDLDKTWAKHSVQKRREVCSKVCPYSSVEHCSSITDFCLKAKEKYPILGRYEADWATADFITTYLRNTSQRRRNPQVTGVSEMGAERTR